MSWVFLSLAIIAEVASTMTLRLVAHGRRALVPVVIVGYVVAFVLISLALSAGMPLGVAYGVWVAAGVALTALLSAAVFGERLTWLMGVGIVLIGAGVLLIELGSSHV